MNVFNIITFTCVGLVAVYGGSGCKYVYTVGNPSNFAALDTCASVFYQTTVGVLTSTTSLSFMYSCTSDEEEVELIVYDDLVCDNETARTTYTTNSDYFKTNLSKSIHKKFIISHPKYIILCKCINYNSLRIRAISRLPMHMRI